MEVYFGGAFQGKLDYVLKKKGNLKVADGRDCDEKQLQSADVVNHLHLLIQRRIAAGESTDTLIEELYAVNPQMILICDEIGSGIVPLERKRQDLQGNCRTCVVCGSGKIRQGGADFMRNRTVPEAGISRNYKIARGKPAGGEVVYEDCADSARSNKGKS